MSVSGASCSPAHLCAVEGGASGEAELPAEVSTKISPRSPGSRGTAVLSVIRPGRHLYVLVQRVCVCVCAGMHVCYVHIGVCVHACV